MQVRKRKGKEEYLYSARLYTAFSLETKSINKSIQQTLRTNTIV